MSLTRRRVGESKQSEAPSHEMEVASRPDARSLMDELVDEWEIIVADSDPTADNGAMVSVDANADNVASVSSAHADDAPQPKRDDNTPAVVYSAVSTSGDHGPTLSRVALRGIVCLCVFAMFTDTRLRMESVQAPLFIAPPSSLQDKGAITSGALVLSPVQPVKSQDGFRLVCGIGALFALYAMAWVAELCYPTFASESEDGANYPVAQNALPAFERAKRVHTLNRRLPSGQQKANPWNDFQKAVGGCGLSRQVVVKLYHHIKASAPACDAQPTVALVRCAASWDGFQNACGGCGLSKPAMSKLYRKVSPPA